MAKRSQLGSGTMTRREFLEYLACKARREALHVLIVADIVWLILDHTVGTPDWFILSPLSLTLFIAALLLCSKEHREAFKSTYKRTRQIVSIVVKLFKSVWKVLGYLNKLMKLLWKE